MTHSLGSGNTLAFLHGWSVFSNQNWVSKRDMISHSERMHSLLEPSISLWRHPLLLPTLLLQEHLFRCEEFIRQDLSPQIRGIERVLGITRSGRLAGTKHAVSEEIQELLTDDERRIQITSEVNTTLSCTSSRDLIPVAYASVDAASLEKWSTAASSSLTVPISIPDSS